VHYTEVYILTKEEMKNCVWLKPELVAQIELTEWTPDGHLRHSKFVGLRKEGEGSCAGRVHNRMISGILSKT
jgi:ATP-dependent DNA ligase